jgi:hypothetical protein
MTGTQARLSEFAPDTPQEIIERIQVDAVYAIAEQGVGLDV